MQRLTNDEQEAIWAIERAETWAKFRSAVESAVRGDSEPARALVKACPELESELRNFCRAVREGRIVADQSSATGFRNVKK